MQHKAENINLTSAEIAYLWNSYVLNLLSKYMIIYSIETAKDEDIKEVLQQALKVSEKLIAGIEKIYKSVDHPIPYGFRESDIMPEADKLFSDVLTLHLLKQYNSFGLSNYGLTLSLSARSDVRELFDTGIKDTIDLINKVDKVALDKGLFVRTPYIPIPKEIEFAQSQSIMGAFIGHKRPLTCMEISSIFTSSLNCSVAQAFYTALAQTREKERVKDFLSKGRRLFKEHVEALNNMLIKENLTIPPTFDSEVYNTKDSPYSDKLALYAAITSAIQAVNMYSITQIGSSRKDIIIILTQLSAELSLFAKDGIDIALDYSWLEEMPKNIDRNDLIEAKSNK